MPRTRGLSANLAAFLDTIAESELGPMLAYPNSDDGYCVIVGSTPKTPILFTDYSDHPHHSVSLPKLNIHSDAAGRYQIMGKWWDRYKPILHLPDFGPLSQDKYALNSIRERKALDLISSGKIEKAIYACSNIWASFPGNDYGQHQNEIDVLRAVYRTFGGKEA